MYRVAKKTTQRTKGKCLKCPYCKELQKIAGGGVIVECTAENRCILTPFNANDFYCIEYKGANDMTETEKDAIRKAIQKDYSKKQFREYANKFYSKKEAQRMIKNYNDKLKGLK